MLEFVCCLPKWRMIPCYCSSLYLNKLASLTLESKMQSTAITSSKNSLCAAHVFVFVLFLTSTQKPTSRFPQAFGDFQSKSKISEWMQAEAKIKFWVVRVKDRELNQRWFKLYIFTREKWYAILLYFLCVSIVSSGVLCSILWELILMSLMQMLFKGQLYLTCRFSL